jgi:hypothetical protein
MIKRLLCWLLHRSFWLDSFTYSRENREVQTVRCGKCGRVWV